MKKYIKIMVLVCLPAILCSVVPVKYTRMNKYRKNEALLSQIMLNRFGEDTYIKLLYLKRDKKNRGTFHVNIRTAVDSTFHFEGLNRPFNEYYDSLFRTVLGTDDYLSLIEADIISSNDTIFYVEPNQETPDLSVYLPYMYSGNAGAIFLMLPNNITDKCIKDSVTWQREAIRDVKEKILEAKKAKSDLIQLRGPVPDSLKKHYEIYNR